MFGRHNPTKPRKTFYVKFPGNFYPLSFEAEDEEDARAQARNFLSVGGRIVKRLPNGTDVWEFTPESRRIISDNHRQMSRDYARAGQIFEP